MYHPKTKLMRILFAAIKNDKQIYSMAQIKQLKNTSVLASAIERTTTTQLARWQYSIGTMIGELKLSGVVTSTILLLAK